MTWTKVLSQDSLTSNSRQSVKVGNRNILLIDRSGELYALENVCPHMKLPMKKGRVTPEGSIVCPWHRSAFDLRTGEVKEWISWPPVVGKAMAMVSKPQPLCVFPVRVEAGSIWVDLD